MSVFGKYDSSDRGRIRYETQLCALKEREKDSIYIQAFYKQKELVKVYKPLSSTWIIGHKCVESLCWAFHLSHIRVIDRLDASSILPPTASGITADGM